MSLSCLVNYAKFATFVNTEILTSLTTLMIIAAAKGLHMVKDDWFFETTRVKELAL